LYPVWRETALIFLLSNITRFVPAGDGASRIAVYPETAFPAYDVLTTYQALLLALDALGLDRRRLGGWRRLEQRPAQRNTSTRHLHDLMDERFQPLHQTKQCALEKHDDAPFEEVVQPLMQRAERVLVLVDTQRKHHLLEIVITHHPLVQRKLWKTKHTRVGPSSV
jgi:hypothetical protein